MRAQLTSTTVVDVSCKLEVAPTPTLVRLRKLVHKVGVGVNSTAQRRITKEADL